MSDEGPYFDGLPMNQDNQLQITPPSLTDFKALVLHEVGKIEPTDPASVHQILDLVTFTNQMSAVARELSAVAKESMIEVINEQGDIEADGQRWYVGSVKTNKCKDVPATMDYLLDFLAGDTDALAELLSSGAFKYGAVKKRIGDDAFNDMFTTTIREDPKTGKPKKEPRKALIK